MKLGSLKKRLGELLVEVGIITRDQLTEALEIQKRNGGRLGRILSQMGIINEEVMLAFLGKQCGVPYVSLTEYGEIPPDVIRSVPESVVKHQTLIPIKKETGSLTVAMADPFNIFAIDDIKLMTGYDVQVVIASESDIQAAIQKYFSHRINPDTMVLTKSTVSEITYAGGETKMLEKDFLVSLAAQAVKDGASAIYLEPDSRSVRFKIDGSLVEKTALNPDMYRNLIQQIRSLQISDEDRDNPFRGIITIRLPDHDRKMGLSLLPTAAGERAVLKIFSTDAVPLQLSQLGFEQEILSVYKKNIELPKGLILHIGPEGSGKTTALYSALTALRYPEHDVMTIENPVECLLGGIHQVQVSSADSLSFPRALDAALRQDPHVLMLSELADAPTAQIAVNAAMNGTLVFTSMTAYTVADALARLGHMGIEPFLIESTLIMVVNQRLMRIICPDCREPYEIARGTLIPNDPAGQEKVILYRGNGCPQCHFTGYRGRTGVFELFEMRTRPSDVSLTQTPEMFLKKIEGQKRPIALQEAALRKLMSGISSVEEMLRITRLSNL